MVENNNSNIETIKETSKEKGNVLEQNVKFIFESAGFQAKTNVHKAKYEIDVYVKIGERIIIAECKNYQNSTLPLRNLIHQWNSKNKIIKASKVILVIAGKTINQSEMDLASEFNMEIWDENILSNLFNLSLKPEELRKTILSNLSLKPISISEMYRDYISKFVIRRIIGTKLLDSNDKYALLNTCLRNFIISKMAINGSTKEEREKHIELFEGAKKKKGFLNFKSKRTEPEYWNKIKERIENEDIFPESIEERYLGYMNELISEYSSQIEFYMNKPKSIVYRKLIHESLYHSIIDSRKCSFSIVNNKQSHSRGIKVEPFSGEEFIIELQLDSEKANIINWILSSVGEQIITEDTYNDTFIWYCSSLDETVEKVYRLIDEYIGYTDVSELREYSI